MEGEKREQGQPQEPSHKIPSCDYEGHFTLLPPVVNLFAFRLQEPVVAIRTVELYLLVSQVSEMYLEFLLALWTHDRKDSDHDLFLLWSSAIRFLSLVRLAKNRYAVENFL